MFIASSAMAQNISWDGGAGTTSWMDAANWSGDVLPTAASNVSIGSGVTVVIPSGTALAKIIGNNGNLTIESGATLTVTDSNSGGHTFNNGDGSLTNNGTLNVSGGSGTLSGLLFQSGVAFLNNGTINLNNIGRRALTFTGGSATNNGIINVSNTGQNTGFSSLGDAFIFNAAGTFTNTGTIVMSSGISANGFLNNSGTIIDNSGSITITAAANGITAGGTFNNTGSGTVDFGTIGGVEIAANVTFNQASTGTVTTTGIINCAGTLKGGGSGNIGSYSNTNITAPGASPGCLNFSSDYTTSGTLQIEINDATPCTQFDQLNVSGIATLGGTLALTITYIPSSTTTLTIIDAGSLSGTFSSVTGLASGWTISYIPGNGNVVLNYIVLPVELVSFEARSLDEVVLLQWQTASELNNEGFHVERSTDGERWTEIGFVTGNGTTTKTHDYSFSGAAGLPQPRQRRRTELVLA
ncbi:MAG: hypothetical protein IPM82_27100 [Saprospiraceae bacterium]|nr:hypothetical protein [Saprospiraceae bacterium]